MPDRHPLDVQYGMGGWIPLHSAKAIFDHALAKERERVAGLLAEAGQRIDAEATTTGATGAIAVLSAQQAKTIIHDTTRLVSGPPASPEVAPARGAEATGRGGELGTGSTTAPATGTPTPALQGLPNPLSQLIDGTWAAHPDLGAGVAAVTVLRDTAARQAVVDELIASRVIVAINAAAWRYIDGRISLGEMQAEGHWRVAG